MNNGNTNANGKTLTSHDMARNLQLAAEWLLSKPAFEIAGQATADTYKYSFFYEKDKFLAAMKVVGSGEKHFTDHAVEFIATIPGGKIVIAAPRSLVCRIVRPAEVVEETQTVSRVVREAEYECTPLLSPEEEQNLGGAA